jgi:hypothetical protein
LGQPSRSRRRLAAGGRPLVASRPWAAGDQRSGPGRGRAIRSRPLVAGSLATSSRRPKVGEPGLTSDQRSPASRRSTPGLAGLFPFLLNFFFFLPSTFCSSGQLFLIGCSTCPPCPNFSLKLQTSITFDP